MFQFLNFDFSSILIGLLVALVGGLLMYMSVLLANKQHTPLSLCVVALFSIIVFVMGVCFVGLCEAKGALEDAQNSSEYQLLQKGEDLLEQYSPELASIVSEYFSTDASSYVILGQIKQINKYLWLDGILTLVLIALGAGGALLTGEKTRSRRGSSRSSSSRHRSGIDDF